MGPMLLKEQLNVLLTMVNTRAAFEPSSLPRLGCGPFLFQAELINPSLGPASLEKLLDDSNRDAIRQNRAANAFP